MIGVRSFKFEYIILQIAITVELFSALGEDLHLQNVTARTHRLRKIPAVRSIVGRIEKVQIDILGKYLFEASIFWSRAG